MFKKLYVPLFLVLSGFSTVTFAAIPAASLTSAVSDITTDANQVFSSVFPVIALILGLIVGIKLFKRFVRSI